MGNQTILKTMHDFLDYVEWLQKENERLRTELSCAEKRLAKMDAEPKEQHSECEWNHDDLPLDGERVVVRTENDTTYMQTYDDRYGFTSDVLAWLRLPEFNND